MISLFTDISSRFRPAYGDAGKFNISSLQRRCLFLYFRATPHALTEYFVIDAISRALCTRMGIGSAWYHAFHEDDIAISLFEYKIAAMPALIFPLYRLYHAASRRAISAGTRSDSFTIISFLSSTAFMISYVPKFALPSLSIP